MAEAIARIETGSAALPSADALFLFLEDLRRDGYRIDARHIAAAQCLLAEARGEGAESPAARRIKFRLAPLIAKSPSQQEDFYLSPLRCLAGRAGGCRPGERGRQA